MSYRFFLIALLVSPIFLRVKINRSVTQWIQTKIDPDLPVWPESLKGLAAEATAEARGLSRVLEFFLFFIFFPCFMNITQYFQFLSPKNITSYPKTILNINELHITKSKNMQILTWYAMLVIFSLKLQLLSYNVKLHK